MSDETRAADLVQTRPSLVTQSRPLDNVPGWPQRLSCLVPGAAYGLKHKP